MTIRFVDRRSPTIRGIAAVLCALLGTSGHPLLFAQTAAPQATTAVAGASAAAKLTNDQLDSLVAPIALYPDPLLSQALVASTYPLELVQAEQWLKKNETLKGDELTKAVEKQKWDPSVQATAVIPDLLKRLTEDISWTQNLGNAFLEQPDDVMDAVQRLRTKAKADGKLESSEQQKVETKVVETQTVIVIEPVSTTVVYVPVYSPTVIWGPPIYPYPPMYYPPYYPGGAWLGFGVGVAVGIGISGGWGWNCGWGRGGNNIYINNNNNFNRINTGNINTGNINRGNSAWQHNPSHRGNAPYASSNTANKFGGTSDRVSSRSSGGAGDVGANRAGAGATSAGAGAASAGANRAGATSASRPTGGDKVGSRSIPQSSSRSSGFGGASSGSTGASRAGSASSRGSSSMGSRGGGGRRR